MFYMKKKIENCGGCEDKNSVRYTEKHEAGTAQHSMKTNMPKKDRAEKQHTWITKCPKCGSRKFVISIFGSICGDCFYEEKSTLKTNKALKR